MARETREIRLISHLCLICFNFLFYFDTDAVYKNVFLVLFSVSQCPDCRRDCETREGKFSSTEHAWQACSCETSGSAQEKGKQTGYGFRF